MSFYEILGVAEDATQEQIKSSYRELAKKYHPDKNPGDSVAEAKMKEVNEAYSTLSNPEARAEYDRKLRGENVRFPQNFTELFRSYIRHQSQILEINVRISLKEVLEGGTRTKTFIVNRIKEVNGNFESDPIEYSHTFDFPPGCRDNVALSYSFNVEKIPCTLRVYFFVDGTDLMFDNLGNVLVDLPVDYPTLILGGTKSVSLLDGEKKDLKIPPGTSPFTKISVSNQGIPRTPGSKVRGNLLFRILMSETIPKNLSTEALDALKVYKEKLEQVSS
jgi:DnaJ-class molecular chaperone